MPVRSRLACAPTLGADDALASFVSQAVCLDSCVCNDRYDEMKGGHGGLNHKGAW